MRKLKTQQMGGLIYVMAVHKQVLALVYHK